MLPFFSGNIVINHVVEIPPEPLKTFKADGTDGFFEAQAPTSHGGPQQVMARLLSPFRTVDIIGNCQTCFNSCSCPLQPASEGIFFHMHGGGFISQLSQQHDKMNLLKHYQIDFVVGLRNPTNRIYDNGLEPLTFLSLASIILWPHKLLTPGMYFRFNYFDEP